MKKDTHPSFFRQLFLMCGFAAWGKGLLLVQLFGLIFLHGAQAIYYFVITGRTYHDDVGLWNTIFPIINLVLSVPYCILFLLAASWFPENLWDVTMTRSKSALDQLYGMVLVCCIIPCFFQFTMVIKYGVELDFSPTSLDWYPYSQSGIVVGCTSLIFVSHVIKCLPGFTEVGPTICEIMHLKKK